MKQIHHWLYRFTANVPTRLIKLNGRPYLERYYLGRLLGVTFYLHRFVSADSERHLHNHPWKWGRALVLTGRYREERVDDVTTALGSGCLTTHRVIRFWNRVNGRDFHRIADAKPNTWTLFFHGPRVQVRRGQASKPKGWGFLDRRVRLSTRNGPVAEVVYTPFPAGSDPEWWNTAPKGRDSLREPGQL